MKRVDFLQLSKEESTPYIRTKWEGEMNEESPGEKWYSMWDVHQTKLNGLEEPNQILHNTSN